MVGVVWVLLVGGVGKETEAGLLQISLTFICKQDAAETNHASLYYLNP